MKKNIAIITGGDSSEEVISVKSASTIFDAVDTSLYKPYLVYISKKKWCVIASDGTEYPIKKEDFTTTVNNENIKFDLAFIIIHGTPGEDGKLQAYFEFVNIPYVGPGVLAASLTFNKYMCKRYLNDFGVKSAKCILIKENEIVDADMVEKELGFPCFVKPNEAGSSFGVTKVYNKSELGEAVTNAQTEGQQVLVEANLSGTEITCGIVKYKNEFLRLPATEIVSSKDFFDFEAKYTPGASEEITPARISDDLTQQCQDLTHFIFNAINLDGFARIDYIIVDNELYLLEVNTVPGMSKESIVPKQIQIAGHTLEGMVNRLISDKLQ